MKPLHLDRYTTTPLQDLLLSKRILNGEKELFELLLRPYDRAVQKALALLLPNSELTDKVILRTYLRALKTLYRFYGQTSFAAWLFSIALDEAQKHNERLLTESDSNPSAISGLQRLCYLLNKAGRLRKRDIAFCLSISYEEVCHHVKTAGRLIREKVVAKPEENPLHHRYNNLTKHIARLFLSESDDDRDTFIEAEMNLILTALLEETKEQETSISMDIEKEHRENLMLCTYIRLGFIKGIEMQRIKNYTDWYWQNHLLAHFIQEESMVFPVLGKSHNLVKKALAQHRRLKRLFESHDDLHKMLSRIEEELLSHVRFEEKVLFKEIAKSVNDSAQSRIDVLHSTSAIEGQWPDQFWK